MSIYGGIHIVHYDKTGRSGCLDTPGGAGPGTATELQEFIMGCYGAILEVAGDLSVFASNPSDHCSPFPILW